MCVWGRTSLLKVFDKILAKKRYVNNNHKLSHHAVIKLDYSILGV